MPGLFLFRLSREKSTISFVLVTNFVSQKEERNTRIYTLNGKISFQTEIAILTCFRKFHKAHTMHPVARSKIQEHLELPLVR